MAHWFMFTKEVAIETLKSAFALCSYTNRMKRNPKAWILFIRESGSFTWRRFAPDILIYSNLICLSPVEMCNCLCFGLSQATNLSSNGSLPRDTREPKENKVRSMATQLLAKFESTPRYTVQNSQVN